MTVDFNTAIGDAHAALDATAGVAIQYRRGQTTAAFTGVVGRSVFDRHEASGLVTELETRDYLFPAARLQALTPAEPQPGDRITDAGEIYEVMPPGPGMPAWRYRDASRSHLRVHTKRIGSVP